MRINTKVLLLLILLVLLFLLFFSSSSDDQAINYKDLLAEIKIREFIKSNIYIGQWNKISEVLLSWSNI